MIGWMKGRIAMPISIKNDQTEQLARQLAELTGETITEAVRAAVAERYDRLRRARSGRSLIDELTVIAQRCARRPIISELSDDEILGYDEAGVPTR
jgi:antitoxin VapB